MNMRVSSACPRISIGAFGVISTALTSFASTREAINQDRRNGERYARTLEALMELRSHLDAVRRAILIGSADALEHFVAAVQEQISTEHRHWLQAGDSTLAAVNKLNEALAEAQKKSKPEVKR